MRKSLFALLLAAPIVAPIAAHADALREWKATPKSLADLVSAGMTVFSVTATKVPNGMQRIFWLRGTLDGHATLAQCGEDFVGMRQPSGNTLFSMTDVGCGTVAQPHRVK